MSDEAIRAEVERQLSVMKDGSVDFYGEEDLRERLALCLREKRPLRVKLGMDPSSPDLHLGHSVVLMKLRRFLELGHTPIFLIGDFTARIGDPSGKKKTRPALSEEEVQENARTYVDQVARILDVDRIEVRFNDQWMSQMQPGDFIRLCSKYTVARLLERDDFAKRYAAGVPIFAHELLYPFVQAYDSVALESDVELGGSDQTFNLLMAREIQRDYGQPPQAVITHPLLVGTDGQEKMSKSLGNAVGLTDAPHEMYGKIMSIPDGLMCEWFDLLCVGEWEEDRPAFEAFSKGEGDPMALKHRLAALTVQRLHGAEAAQAGAAHFRKVVQDKAVPDDVPTTDLSLGDEGEMPLLEVLDRAGLVKSRSEGRRLVRQGAVSVNGVRASDALAGLGAGSHLLRVGKRRYLQVQLSR
ncbi:MAG: tyrosine--tRNA ligase [Deltaproteobacteria bacterium]|jgi:tyrosyl-tRNA synthetase|nr:tyrosine--tRNA ligase [Deltaproteobacteria bacterium]